MSKPTQNSSVATQPTTFVRPEYLYPGWRPKD